MKFDRQLRPTTETSWVVSYVGKTIPRWRTAAIFKIVISLYLSEKSSDFDEILYTAADFELDERHVIKNEKVALDRLRVRQNVFLVSMISRRYTVVLNYRLIQMLWISVVLSKFHKIIGVDLFASISPTFYMAEIVLCIISYIILLHCWLPLVH